MNCKICNKEFKNNKDGSLTKHLKLDHNLELYQYIIKFEYNDISPKCKCGCGELPEFDRGKFKRYVKWHRLEKHKISKYLNAHSKPTCLYCGKDVKFDRGCPRKYCSIICAGKHNGGFTKPEVQDKIIKVVFDKYGVDNISKDLNIRKKISNSLKGNHNLGHCKDSKKEVIRRRNLSMMAKNRWNDPIWKKNTSEKIKNATNAPEVRKFRSNTIKLKIINDPSYLEIFKCNTFKLSKLHIKIREILKLDKYGFISEQHIKNTPYIVDELNDVKKIIIEINGDYIHANPKKYKSTDIISTHLGKYMAEEKWEYDKIRLNRIESQGYKVITIWESDNLDEVKKKLLNIIK